MKVHALLKNKVARIEVSISSIDGADLALELMAGEIVTVSRRNIIKVAFFKTDDVTFDTVWCELVAQKEDQLACYLIDEEQQHFIDLDKWLSDLPGFHQNWRDAVILPPFEERYTVAFEARR